MLIKYWVLNKEGETEKAMAALEREMMLSDVTSDARVITEGVPPYRIVHANLAWLRATGYTEDQVLGKSCSMLQGAETCQRTMQVLHDALRCSRPITVRLLNYRADGVPFVNDLTVLPVTDPNSKVNTHFLGIMRDRLLSGVSQEPVLPQNQTILPAMPMTMRAESGSTGVRCDAWASGRKSVPSFPTVPTHFQEALQRDVPTPQMISERQPPHKIVHVNSAFCESCGFKPEELLGRPCSFLYGPETSPAVQHYIENAFRIGRQVSCDALYYLKLQQPWKCHHIVSPLIDSTGLSTTYFVHLLYLIAPGHFSSRATDYHSSTSAAPAAVSNKADDASNLAGKNEISPCNVKERSMPKSSERDNSVDGNSSNNDAFSGDDEALADDDASADEGYHCNEPSDGLDANASSPATANSLPLTASHGSAARGGAQALIPRHELGKQLSRGSTAHHSMQNPSGQSSATYNNIHSFCDFRNGHSSDRGLALASLPPTSIALDRAVGIGNLCREAASEEPGSHGPGNLGNGPQETNSDDGSGSNGSGSNGGSGSGSGSGSCNSAATTIACLHRNSASAANNTSRVPPFLTKLFTIVDDAQPEDYAGWTQDGNAFRISEPQKFADRCLPRFFKHNKLGSFQQQLLTYGFQRVPNTSCLDISSVWKNPNFRRGKPQLLELIQRASSKRASASLNAAADDDTAATKNGDEEDNHDSELPDLHVHIEVLTSTLADLREELRSARTMELDALEMLAQRVHKRLRGFGNKPASSGTSTTASNEEPPAKPA